MDNMSTEKVVEFTPIETGNMSEIPPDAPEGGWTGLLAVKKGATAKDSFPMLILEWQLVSANEDENEDAVGGKLADFLCFFPERHKGAGMARQKLRDLCLSLKVDVPSTTSIKSWADIQDFIDEIDGQRAPIYTRHKVDKKTGQLRTEVAYTPPGGNGKFVARPSSPNVNGKGNGHATKAPNSKKAKN
jgi:hypothetical protein